MKHNNFFLAVLLGLSLGGAFVAGEIVCASPAFAATDKLSPAVGKPLQEAQALAKAGDFKGAIAKAKEAQAIRPKTSYEEFVVDDFLGYLYNSTRDYRDAIDSLDAALKYAPASEKGKRIKTLAQLAYQIHDYGKTISYANRYLSEIGPDADLQILVANCYYQERNYQQSMAASKTIIDQADTAGKAPNKTALALYLASAYQLKDQGAIKATLFRLVQLYPSDAYWTTLIKEISNEGLGNYTALDMQWIQLRLNQLKSDDDYFNMAKLAYALKLPGDAKTILDIGFQKKILGSAPDNRDQRLQAVVAAAAQKDLAALPADDAAAAAGNIGDADILVAQRYASYGQYDKAIAAFSRGLAKPGLSNPDEDRLEFGRVLLLAKKPDQARRAFAGIKEEGSTKDVAHLFLIVG